MKTILTIFLFTYTLFPNTRVLVNYESGVNETIYIYESLIYFDELDNDIFIDSLTAERSKIDIEIKSPKYLKFVTSKNKVFYFNILPDKKLELNIDDDKQIIQVNQEDINISEFDKLTEILSDSIANSNLGSSRSLLLYQKYLEKLPNSFTFSSFFFLQNSIYPLDENDFKKLLIELKRSRMNDTYYKVSLLLFLQEIINLDLDSVYKMEILEIIKSKMVTSQEKSTVLYLENKLLRELGLKDVDESYISQYSFGENSLFYFSASWCQPCIEAVDSVQKAIKLLKERNQFSMRIFSLESDNSKQPELEKIYGKGNVYILENASEHPLSKYFNVNSVPTIIILKNKRIQSRNLISPLELPGYISCFVVVLPFWIDIFGGAGYVIEEWAFSFSLIMLCLVNMIDWFSVDKKVFKIATISLSLVVSSVIVGSITNVELIHKIALTLRALASIFMYFYFFKMLYLQTKDQMGVKGITTS